MIPLPNEEVTPPVTKIYFVSFTFMFLLKITTCWFVFLSLQISEKKMDNENESNKLSIKN